MQEFCGPEKEACVVNQTLEDSSCLVPCDGLYADITDDYLKKDLIKGGQYFFDTLNPFQGFHLMNQELSEGVKWNEGLHKARLQATLKDMFPISAHEKDREAKEAIARYLEYKRNHVKHINFNPNEANFSKYK